MELDWPIVHDYGHLGRLVHVMSSALRTHYRTHSSRRRIFGVNLTDGGPAACVYSFLFCWLGNTAVISSLAELVSFMPTAASQYYWAYELAPPKHRKFIAWITGWQITVAWQANLAAVFYLGGTISQGTVVLN